MNSAQNPENGAPGPHHSFAQWLRTWRHLFVFLVLCALVLLFYAEENWRGYHAWQTYKQQMADRGEPTEPEAFIPPPVADDQNFAMTPSLAPLFEFVAGTQHWIDPNAPKLFDSITPAFNAASSRVKTPPATRLNSWVRANTDLNTWAWAFSLGTNRSNQEREPLVPAVFDPRDAATQVLHNLADFDSVLDELRNASRRPYSRFNLRYQEDNPAGILLPHLAKIKLICQVLQLRASAELALDHTADAQGDIELMFYLANTTRDEPIVISQLVRMAEVQLALQPLGEGMGKWSEPQLKSFQARLQALDFIAEVKHSLQAERSLFGDGVIEYVRHASNKLQVMDELSRTGDGSSELGPVGLLMAAAPRGWLYQEQVGYSRLFNENLLPLLDVTNHLIRPDKTRTAEAVVTAATQGSPVSKFLHHRFFASLMLPALSRIAEKTALNQTAVDEAALACALERYRLAHGQFPDSLEKLAPQFIGTVPRDLVTGQPLTYHLEPDGHYVLYSVGWNEKDEGGEIKQTKGGGIEPHEGDWVWSDAH